MALGMGPGFHRLYADRLAWRYRLGLALGLALLGLLHPTWALASPLALLLPARPFEGQALRAIARKSLAYPTALAYGEERLWQEARRARVELPPFPGWLLLAYLLVLVLALAPALWKDPGGGTWLPPGVERTLEPAREASSPEGKGPRDEGQAGAEATQGGPPGPTPSSSGTKTPSFPGGREEREAPASGQEGRRPGPGEAPSGQRPQGTPGLGERETQGPSLEPPPLPSGPEEGLLSPEGQGGASPLPTPWPQGQPPERVRRGVEVYLERTPLSPEDRELLRRYFGVP
ncbi:MAG: hypothetical protein ACP5JV_07750 [Thermus sp.]|uniref:hypothetical protein n=1 Tax=Thermus sp. TaxID=275 RepID=UPI003D0C6E7F